MRFTRALLPIGLCALTISAGATQASAQRETTTARRPDEGEGPFNRLILRGATIIDGTGAPPRGPVDIVIEDDRITEVRSVGFPGRTDRSGRSPRFG